VSDTVELLLNGPLGTDSVTLIGTTGGTTVRDRAPAYFSKRLRRVRALSSEDLDEFLESLIERGLLGEPDASDVWRSDLVVRGRRRDDGAEV